MAVQIRERWITPEEYLVIERAAETKSEYFNGRMFAMAGASEPHNLIGSNTNRLIGNQIESKPCRTYISDMKVRIQATGLITYPDVIVLCGKPEFFDDRRDVIENPTVLVEVLSPFDRSL